MSASVIALLLDGLALRKHVVHPWKFLLERKRAAAEGFLDIEMRDGSTFRLRDRPIDRHIFHRVFARDEYRLEGHGQQSLGTVVDIGANIGTFAVRAAPLSARLLCYEPVPENFALLKRNTAHIPQVQAHEWAIADRAGTAAIQLSANPGGHSLLAADGGAVATVEVRVAPIADVFADHRIERCGLLKLDCEGAEYPIVASMGPALLAKVDRICLEYHAIPDRPEWTGESLARSLERGGHEVELNPRKAGRGFIFSRKK